MEKISLKQTATLLEQLDDIVISAHIGPDGDAIGSVCALLLAYRAMGKRVCAVLETFPHKFMHIPGADLIKTDLDKAEKYKAFIALDCADKVRLGRFVKYFDEAYVTVNIDHHISNECFAGFNYVDANASATAEIIYNLINLSTNCGGAFKLDINISSAIYAGILYDTGGFRHPSTTSSTYFAAGELINHGADFCNLYKRLFNTRKYEELQIMSAAFRKIKRQFDNRLIWTNITNDDLKAAGAKLGDLDSIVDWLKSVEGSKIAVLYYQKKDGEYKASFRSEIMFDVNKIAKKFGGGGHKNAAGCSFFIPLDEAVDAVTKEIEALFGRID